MKYQNVSFSVYPSAKYSENFQKIFGKKISLPKPTRCRYCKKRPQIYNAEGIWHVACHVHEPEIINEAVAALESEAIEQWNTANERS